MSIWFEQNKIHAINSETSVSNQKMLDRLACISQRMKPWITIWESHVSTMMQCHDVFFFFLTNAMYTLPTFHRQNWRWDFFIDHADSGNFKIIYNLSVKQTNMPGAKRSHHSVTPMYYIYTSFYQEQSVFTQDEQRPLLNDSLIPTEFNLARLVVSEWMTRAIWNKPVQWKGFSLF